MKSPQPIPVALTRKVSALRQELRLREGHVEAHHHLVRVEGVYAHCGFGGVGGRTGVSAQNSERVLVFIQHEGALVNCNVTWGK